MKPRLKPLVGSELQGNRIVPIQDFVHAEYGGPSKGYGPTSKAHPYKNTTPSTVFTLHPYHSVFQSPNAEGALLSLLPGLRAKSPNPIPLHQPPVARVVVPGNEDVCGPYFHKWSAQISVAYASKWHAAARDRVGCLAAAESSCTEGPLCRGEGGPPHLHLSCGHNPTAPPPIYIKSFLPGFVPQTSARDQSQAGPWQTLKNPNCAKKRRPHTTTRAHIQQCVDSASPESNEKNILCLQGGPTQSKMQQAQHERRS